MIEPQNSLNISSEGIYFLSLGGIGEIGAKAIKLSGAEMVTVAVRRVNIIDKNKPLLMDYIDPKNLTNTEVLDNYKELAFIGAGRAEHTLFVLHSPGVDKSLGFSGVEFL